MVSGVDRPCVVGERAGQVDRQVEQYCAVNAVAEFRHARDILRSFD
jgi:hypothetical protein